MSEGFICTKCRKLIKGFVTYGKTVTPDKGTETYWLCASCAKEKP